MIGLADFNSSLTKTTPLLPKTLICLVNLGTPLFLNSQSIRLFLAEFLSDKRVVNLPRWLWLPMLYGFILPFRSKKLVAKYRSIWINQDGVSASPLSYYTQSLTHQLNHTFKANSQPFIASYAMRYSEDKRFSFKSVIKEHLKNHTIDRIIVLPLYPQFSTTTTLSVVDEVVAFQKHCELSSIPTPPIHTIQSYALKAPYHQAIVQSMMAHLPDDFGQKGDHLLFSFHSIPQKIADEGDVYPQHCEESFNSIIKHLPFEKHFFSMSYQSKFGKAKWLEPTTDKTIEQLACRQVKRLVVVCPGFSADCLETLEEINQEAREIFLSLGGEQFIYIPALNDSTFQQKMIVDLVQAELKTYQNLSNP